MTPKSFASWLNQHHTGALVPDAEPRHPSTPQAQLIARLLQGEPAAARTALAELIAFAPDFPGALPAYARLVFPGPSDREVLQRLHAGLTPEVYLEVGVETGASLALAVHSRIALGIDPVPQLMPGTLPPSARLFPLTSDAFFQQHSRTAVLGDARVDLAFIDGMHWFECALRDFANVERWCGPGSVIILHDCLPVHAASAQRDRRTNFWVGDTWKALEYLLEHRRDLAISVVPCYPSGLVIVQIPDPGAHGSHDRLDPFRAGPGSWPFPFTDGQWPAHYPLIENSEQGLAALVASLAARRPGARAT